MENCHNNYMNQGYDVFHQFSDHLHLNDGLPSIENEHYQAAAGSKDMLLTNVFVRIPIHPLQKENNMRVASLQRENQNSQSSRDREIKSEPIKSELGDSHTAQPVNQGLLPRSANSGNESTSNLVTARPKTSLKCHKCEKCPFLSIAESRLLEHTAAFHPESTDTNSTNATSYTTPRKLVCPGCDNVIYARKSLEVHLELDHQMAANEIQQLVESLVESPAAPTESDSKKNRIYLKSVDVLRNPNFNEPASQSTAESMEQFPSPLSMDDPSIDNSMILIDLINSNSQNQGALFDPQSSHKISIRNVDILREPGFFDDSLPVVTDDETKNFPSESNQRSKVCYDMDTGFINECSEDDLQDYVAPVEMPSDSVNSRGKAKIYIKNVDILKEPIFVPPVNLTNILNVNDNLNLNLISSHDDRPAIISNHYNFSINPPKSKIFIKNMDILNQPNFDSFQKKSTNSLHLRTVDELNLMNMNEVQNLMAPRFDQNVVSQPATIPSSENSKNSDEVVLNGTNTSYNLLPDLAYNQDTGFNVSEAELIQSNWSNYYNFDELDTIIDPNLKPSSTPYSHFDLNTPQQVMNEESDQDILFVCAQELINDNPATMTSTADSRSFPTEVDFIQAQPLVQFAELSQPQQEVVEILDDLENQNYGGGDGVVVVGGGMDESGDVVAPEKGRIYVAGNLMEDRSEKLNEAVKAGKGYRGRPMGAKQTGITRLRKRQNNVTPNEIGYHKCDLDCAFRFRESSNLEYHKRCHTSSQQRMQCPDCNKEDFTSWNTLHTHLWRVHNIDMELYSCQHCPFKTPILSRLLNTHIKIHSNERNFKCDQCEKAFKNTKQLKDHRRLHRLATTTTLEVHVCTQCDSSFSRFRSLRDHIRNKHTENGDVRKRQANCDETTAKFQCDKCSYNSNDNNAFRRHKMTHDNSKRYQCQFCDYACIQSNMYQKHLLRRHPDLASLVINNCTHCSFSTINRTNFEVHLARHKDTAEVDRTTQSCDIIDDSVDSLTGTSVCQSFESERNCFNVSLELDTDHRNKIKVKSNSVLTDPSKFCTLSEIAMQNLESGVT